MFVTTLDTFGGVAFVFSNGVLGRSIHLQCGQGKDQASHLEKGVVTVQLIISHIYSWDGQLEGKHDEEI